MKININTLNHAPENTHTHIIPHTLFQSIKQLHVLLNLYFVNSQTQVQMLSHQVSQTRSIGITFLSTVTWITKAGTISRRVHPTFCIVSKGQIKNGLRDDLKETKPKGQIKNLRVLSTWQRLESYPSSKSPLMLGYYNVCKGINELGFGGDQNLHTYSHARFATPASHNPQGCYLHFSENDM